MKIKNVIIATFSVALLASCGGTDVCSCLDTSLEMGKEMEKANGDEAKIKEITESYQSDMDACKKMGEDMEKEMEGKTDEEKKAKRDEMMKEMEECPAYKEMTGE